MLKILRNGHGMEIQIPEKWEGKTIAEIFLNVWNSPKKLTHFFRIGKKVYLNGEHANWNAPLTCKDKLLIELFSEEEIKEIPAFHEIYILYEDDHILVLNKPPFMNTHPNEQGIDNDTLLNAAQFHMVSKGERRNIRHVHRLDRDTSGAILFAKHPLAGAILDRMLEKREIKRTYIAMVHGLLSKKKGIISEPIGRDRHHPTRRRVSHSGQTATTHYQELKENKKMNISFVKCWLDTGRTHQIRVHFSHIRHPLVGDTLYGGKPICTRQALHAAKLEFFHPFTEEKIICHAPFMDQPPIFKDIDIYSI